MRLLVPPITASLVAACVLVSVGCTDPTTVTAPVGSTDADHITPVYFPDQGTGDFDVASYDVEATVSIDGTDRLDATATIVATAMDDLARIRLDLDGLTVTGATVDGRAAQIERTEHTLEIVPPTTVSAGDEFVAVVTYGGAPAGGEDPATVLEDLGGGWLDLGAYSAVVAEPTGASTWLPVNDRPSDKATFALSVTVPAPLVAVSNGELVERVDQGGNTTFRWAAPEPMAPYLMTLVVGALDLVERRVPGGPSVIDALPPALAPGTDQSPFARFDDMVAFFASRFGPYPFSTAGNVVVPGMPLTALECQTRSVISLSAVAGSDAESEELVAHELAHQWFGDSVTPASWNDIWLNEGPAVYAQWLWTEHAGGRSVQESARRSYDPDDPALDVPPGDPGEEELFGPAVYERSAIFLVELRRRMGDVRFAELWPAWTAEHRYANATTEDFVELAGRVNGASVRDLSDLWLYGKSLPRLAL